MKKEFKYELIVAFTFGILAVSSVKYIGFENLYTSLFTIIVIAFVPYSYFCARFLRKFLHMIKSGELIYENK